MLQALGHLLPIAVAVALSSVPITATIVILLSSNRGRSAVPFLIGWVLGIAILIIAFALGANALPESSAKHQDVIVGIVQIVIGSALVIFAIIVWRRARTKPTPALPRWLSAVGSMRPISSLGLGFVLNLRPKGLLLSIAAGLALAEVPLIPSTAITVVVIYVLIAASTVAVPIIVTLAAPKKMEPRLVSARDWMGRNSVIVTTLIMIMIGVVIIGNGMTKL